MIKPCRQELAARCFPGFRQQRQTGDIFGGWATAQVDLAGPVLPARYVRGRIATVAVAVAVAVNEFIFKQPVRIGDLLSFFPHLTRFGRTSITVELRSMPSAARVMWASTAR